MSYILEALKKAEQQRELGQVPGIASEHDAGTAGVSRRWLWLVLLLVNAAVLLLLAVLWLRSGSTPEPAPAAAVVVEPEVLARVPVAPSLQSARLAPLPVVSEEPDFPVIPMDEEPVAWEDDIDAPEPMPRVAEPVADQPEAGLPVWPGVPDALRGQISGELRLDVHVYSEQPQDRFVLINLAKYRQGELLPNGATIQEITPGGAVISLRGERFRLLAQ